MPWYVPRVQNKVSFAIDAKAAFGVDIMGHDGHDGHDRHAEELH